MTSKALHYRSYDLLWFTMSYNSYLLLPTSRLSAKSERETSRHACAA